MTSPILAAHNWRTNGDLIADAARLGYLDDQLETIDPTWGRGRWWTVFTPCRLTRHDLHTLDGTDFRQLPHEDGAFARAAYDPPYVCPGGRETSTMPEFHDRYGMARTPKTPAGLQEMNDEGLAEVYRVLEAKGIVLAKCADYVWSGQLQAGTHDTLTAALALGFRLLDRFEHIGIPRPQPSRSRADGEPVRQHHARRNLSTMFVLQKPGRTRRTNQERQGAMAL